MKIKRIISIANDFESRVKNEEITDLLYKRSISPREVGIILDCTLDEATDLINYCQPANIGYKTPRVNTIEFFRQILRAYNIQPLMDWINARVPVPLEHVSNIRDVYFSFDDVFQFVER